MIVFLIAAFALNACGGQPAASSTEAPTAPAASTPVATVAEIKLNRDPKTLVIAYADSPDNADPSQTLYASNNLITRSIYEGLLTLKGGSLTEVEPRLAESYTTNADKSQWIFKIRKGVMFHDGSPLDAQAIYDSYARTIVNKLTTWYILGRFVGED